MPFLLLAFTLKWLWKTYIEMIARLNGGTLNQPVSRWNKVLTSIFQAFLASETTFPCVVNENLRICLLRQTVLLIPTNTICCHNLLIPWLFMQYLAHFFCFYFPLYPAGMLCPILIFIILINPPISTSPFYFC